MPEPTLNPDELIQESREALAEGNLPLADILGQAVLVVTGRESEALEILAEVALRAGKYDFAADYLRRALASGPARPELRQKLVEAEARAAHRPSAGDSEKFLLIKAWGNGFWSDVDQVLGSVLLAELEGRTPVVHWGGNSLFSDDPATNAWDSFFEPVSRATFADVVRAGDFFPPKWTASNLRQGAVNQWTGDFSRCAGPLLFNRPQRVVVADFHNSVTVLKPWIPDVHPLNPLSVAELYQYLISKYLKPKPAIMRQVDQFWQANLAGRPAIAVHVRGSDKRLEVDDLDEINTRYFGMLGALPPNSPHRIFLLTDDAAVVNTWLRRYANRLVVAQCARTADQTGVHFKPAPGGKKQLGVEVMRDTYIAARCDWFMGLGGSNVSCMITYLKHWGPHRCKLFTDNRHLRLNPLIFRRAQSQL